MTKTMTLDQVPQGGRFVLGQLDLIKLDEDNEAAFAATAATLPLCVPLEDPCSDRAAFNCYAGSFLEQHVVAITVDNVVRPSAVPRPIDLTAMDGSTDYGQPYVVGRVLTVDELRKYQRLLPRVDRPYWLATPWHAREPEWGTVCTPGGMVRRARVDAGLVAARPALWLRNDTVVTVEG